ncbi:MAG TPA: SCO family protein [Bacteroidia bacterium]|nr:SCO family protein [Bacteroidia bacterium]
MKNYIKLVLLLIVLLFNGCKNNNDEHKECCKPTDLSEELGKNSDVESLYLIEGSWLNEEGVPFELEGLKGKVQVVSMIFSHCEYACPRLIADMQQIEEKIPSDKRDQVNFLLVSFDVERDTPQRLKEFKTMENLGDNYTFLHGNEAEVRMLSVLLNIKYEKQSDGNFAHSNIITVLDQNGVIRNQIEGLGADPKPILNTISSLVK